MQDSVKRSTLYNFLGQVLPAVCMFASVPFLIRQLGDEIYGIFAIIILIVDYFSFFDIGLSGAATKFISESIGKKDYSGIHSIYKKLLLLSVCLSCLAAILYFIFVPWISTKFLNIERYNISDIQSILRTSSIVVFFLMQKCFFRGVLEAYQRWDYINFTMVPILALTQLAYVVAVLNGKGLLVLVCLLSMREALICFIYYIAGQRILHKTNQPTVISWKETFTMVKYGMHLSITRIIAWFMSSFDKFLISSVLTTAAVTYYVVPYGVATKIAMVAGCIAPIIFPISSKLYASDRVALMDLFKKSLVYSSVLMGLPMILMILFAKDILFLWVGPEFAQSVPILQVLSLGAFFSAISWIFGTLIQGTGHPKLVSRWGIILLPIELATMYTLLKTIGLLGAAISWTTMRGITVMVFFFYADRYLELVEGKMLKDKRLFQVVLGIAMVCFVTAFAKNLLGHALIPFLINVTIFSSLYMLVIAWKVSGIKQLLNPYSFFSKNS